MELFLVASYISGSLPACSTLLALSAALGSATVDKQAVVALQMGRSALGWGSLDTIFRTFDAALLSRRLTPAFFFFLASASSVLLVMVSEDSVMLSLSALSCWIGIDKVLRSRGAASCQSMVLLLFWLAFISDERA
jgi:hypothetical protein